MRAVVSIVVLWLNAAVQGWNASRSDTRFAMWSCGFCFGMAAAATIVEGLRARADSKA